MIDALRITELIEHAAANQRLIEEHRVGLDRALARRLVILHALLDLGISQTDVAEVLGMTRSRVNQILKDEGRLRRDSHVVRRNAVSTVPEADPVDGGGGEPGQR